MGFHGELYLNILALKTSRCGRKLKLTGASSPDCYTPDSNTSSVAHVSWWSSVNDICLWRP